MLPTSWVHQQSDVHLSSSIIIIHQCRIMYLYLYLYVSYEQPKCIYTFGVLCMWVCECVCIHECKFIMCVCVYICMYVSCLCMYVWICMYYVYVWICIYVCMCECVCPFVVLLPYSYRWQPRIGTFHQFVRCSASVGSLSSVSRLLN
jgi:hypothetical protein